MSKPILIPFIIMISFYGIRIYAFDPFTMMTVASTAASMFNSAKGIAETAGDLMQFADVLGETGEAIEETQGLASELGYEGDSNELDGKAIRLEKLNSQLKDLKWTNDELRYSFDSDITSTKSLSQKIRQMKKIVSISKKLAGTFGLKTKGSEKVAALQQVKLDSLMLDELQAMRKVQLLSYLEDKERIAKQDIMLNRIITEENTKSNMKRKN
ncbi:MAG: hypothetical protein H7336_15380 [Bacteriovorax sp.]|nr:hypothetical protein [Bacteriovorax sp.]